MPNPTPGQIAFIAWECAMLDRAPAEVTHLWPLLGAHEQHAWEAAAQAVVACRFPLGQRVVCAEEPGVVWQIVKRHRHESPSSVWVTYDLYAPEHGAHRGRARTAYEPDLAPLEDTP